MPSITAFLITSFLATIGACCTSGQGQVNFYKDTDCNIYLGPVCTSPDITIGGPYGSQSAIVVEEPTGSRGTLASPRVP